MTSSDGGLRRWVLFAEERESVDWPSVAALLLLLATVSVSSFRAFLLSR